MTAPIYWGLWCAIVLATLALLGCLQKIVRATGDVSDRVMFLVIAALSGMAIFAVISLI